MPIGTSKIGVLGGKIPVPAGSQTFNASGTFTAPIGLKTVSITGRGAAGNTGSTGNSGNSGNGGNGGSGIVIISYLGSQRGTGGTVTTSGGYTIHTFTSSSTYNA